MQSPAPTEPLLMAQATKPGQPPCSEPAAAAAPFCIPRRRRIRRARRKEACLATSSGYPQLRLLLHGPTRAANLGRKRGVLLKWSGGRRFASQVCHLWDGGVRAWMKLVNLLLSQQRPLVVDRQLVGLSEDFDQCFLGLLFQPACQVLQITPESRELRLR